MEITKTSIHSGITRTLDLDVTLDEYADCKAGELIQNAMRGINFIQLQFKDGSGDWVDPQDATDIQAGVPLSNGLSVSVVKNSLSYGGQKGLYEVGVFNGESMYEVDDWNGDQVRGWLDEEEVELTLDYLASL